MTSFKLLSYNVWFESLKLVERMRAIGEIIAAHSPDIITVQEVQRDILACFQAAEWYKQYTVTRLPFYESYFTLIFSKGPIRQFSQSALMRSIMGRDLKVVEVTMAGRSCVFATAHLESPVGPWQGGPPDQFSSVRALQLAQVLGTLGGLSCPNVFFSGDTNWIARDGAMDLSPGWTDAWPTLRPGEVSMEMICTMHACCCCGDCYDSLGVVLLTISPLVAREHIRREAQQNAYIEYQQ